MLKIFNTAMLAGMSLGLVACDGGGRIELTEFGQRADSSSRVAPVFGGIKGTVGGQEYRFDGDMRYTVDGAQRSLKVLNIESDQSYWSIQGLKPSLGQYSCANDGLELMLQTTDGATLSSDSASDCTVTVTQAHSRMLAGEFQATLVDAQGQGHMVSDGRFEFALAHVIPDLDQDGLSDADDNCPFAANPDQADEDGNLVGDACDPNYSEDA